MKRGALVFAEVFIVLSLIFLIQTAIHFSVFDGEEDAERSDLIVLSLRQVPSGGDLTDHIRFISFGDLAFEIDPIPGGCSGAPSINLLRSQVDSTGYCVPIDEKKFFNIEIEVNFEEFARVLDERYKIEATRVSVEGLQNEYVFVWRPDELPENTVLRVGVCQCNLHGEGEPDPKILDPGWGVKLERSAHPHPLIVSVQKYKDTIETFPMYFYSHKDQFAGFRLPGRVIQPSGRLAGFAFRENQCELPSSELRAARQDHVFLATIDVNGL